MTNAHRRGHSIVHGIVQDVRFAVRLLAKDRRFTVAAVCALALGIAVNNSVFTLINAALIRELPFEDSDQLITVRTVNRQSGAAGGLSYAEFLDLSSAARTSFTGLAASVQATMNIGDPGRAPERVQGAYVSASTTALLGRDAALGRGFRAEDEQPGAPPVVIISESLWRRRYASDPSIVGRTVILDDVPATVVGVMPRGFKYPLITQAWRPLTSWASLSSTRTTRPLAGIARLRAGVTVPQARAELDQIAQRLAQSYPASNADVTVTTEQLLAGAREAARPILTTIMGAVSLVLLAACANIAILLLARSAGRAREIAVRVSLGATRWRIVRQLLVECVLLSTVASAIGMLLSAYGARTLGVGFNVIDPGAAVEDTVPYWVDLTMNRSAYAFVGLTALFSTFAFGLVPALQLSRTDVVATLKGDSGRTGLVSAQRWSSVLTVVQLAMAVALLAGMGLLWRSFAATVRTNLGIDTPNIVVARLTLPAPRYDAARRGQFVRQLDDRLRSVSSHTSVTVASAGPLDPTPTRVLSIEGREVATAGAAPEVAYVLSDRHYFDTLRLAILRGRAFVEGDDAIGQERAIVNERFVTTFLPDADPVGLRIRVHDRSAADRPSPWLTIVGVARTIPGLGRGFDTRPVVYAPLSVDAGADVGPPSTLTLLARGATVSAAAATLREEVRALDAGVPLYGVESLDTALQRAGYGQRLLGTWFGLLAGIALVLAGVGVYATTAHSVTRRTQEIGIRLAVGATGGNILALFMRRAIVQVLIGLTLGLGGALVFGRLLAGFLVRTSPRDPVTLVAVVVVLAAVALAASLIPARRAARVDPMDSLRAL